MSAAALREQLKDVLEHLRDEIDGSEEERSHDGRISRLIEAVEDALTLVSTAEKRQ